MTPIPSRERLRRQSPRILARRLLLVAGLPWLSVAVTLPGSCCGRWRGKISLGRVCMYVRSTSVWPPTDTRTETSHTCAKTCFSMPLCARNRSMPCRWRRLTCKPQPRNTPLLSVRSPDRRRCSTSSTSVSALTATLVPGDPVLDVTGADVAPTGVYQGRRRMTLTYPMLNRARRVLWVVTGSEKVEMLRRLRDGDVSIPAGRVRREQALVLTDRAAAGQVAAEYK